MAKLAPLDERIPNALTGTLTSKQVAAVRDEAEEALATALAEADAADQASLSPLATRAQAGELRARANELRFEADRLQASVAALRNRVTELTRSERKALDAAEHTAALAERDQLAAEIAAEYPGIVRRLTQLVQRIDASDRRCSRAGIRESAEAIGRGIQANFYAQGSPILRLGNVHLPMPAGPFPAWEETFAGSAWRGLELPAVEREA